MKRIVIIVALVVACIIIVAVVRNQQGSRFVVVGSYGYGADPTGSEIKLLYTELEKNHIGVMTYGSAGYSIAAPSRDAEQARKIINSVVLKNGLKTICAVDEKGNVIPTKKE